MSWNPPKLQVKSIKIHSNSKKKPKTNTEGKKERKSRQKNKQKNKQKQFSQDFQLKLYPPVNKLVRDNFQTKEIWIYFWILEQLPEQLETELWDYLIL